MRYLVPVSGKDNGSGFREVLISSDDEEAAARTLFRWMSRVHPYREHLEGLDVELFVDHMLSHGSIQYSSGLSVELIEIDAGKERGHAKVCNTRLR